jgi:hypothetical protein
MYSGLQYHLLDTKTKVVKASYLIVQSENPAEEATEYFRSMRADDPSRYRIVVELGAQ